MKQYSFTINGKSYDVRVESVQDGQAEVLVNGTPYQVSLNDTAPAEPAPVVQPEPVKTKAPARHRPLPVQPGTAVVSPMPGIILQVCVREGQTVKRGQKVAVLEAMKMENDILADCDGTVTGIYVNNGDSVADGVKILTIG